MSGLPPTTEWYIARDGAQHGPVSDAEMRKFVELGYLRSTDLVWCARFTAWQTGGQVFPETLQQNLPSAAPSAQPAAHAQPGSEPRPASAQQSTTPVKMAADAAQSRADVAWPTAQHPSAQQPAVQQSAPGKPVTDDAAWADAMRALVDAAPKTAADAPAQSQAAFAARARAGATAAPRAAAAQHGLDGPASFEPSPDRSMGNLGLGIQGSGSHGLGHPMGPAPVSEPASITGPAPFARRSQSAMSAEADGRTPSIPEDFAEPAPAKSRRSWIGIATVALAIILILGGLGWVSWQNRALVTGAGASAIGTVMSAARPNVPTADHFRAPPYQVAGETREQIDASMQRIAVWRFLKREFADWYNEIVADVERRRGQKQDERVITQFLVDVIVTLRRRHALAALQSSPEHLKAMAAAFVTNLKQLGSRDGATCFAFVSHGESSPFMIELSKTPAFAETLQKQMISVFEAVVDGRANRKIHSNTRRPDYERLTADLLARGWSQNDLATFSDPQKLSLTLPDKVCGLVQDWFTAQLQLKEPDLQVRLLAESLKPLVGG